MTTSRVLSVKPCAWCGVNPVTVTTKDRRADRPLKRFCSRQCINAAGGITHNEDWGRKMQAGSAAAMKRLALERATAILRRYTPDEAAKRIREAGYKAGWKTGYAHGRQMEYARLYRELKRKGIDIEAVEAA